MDLTELPILQHFLVYIKTNSKKGFNPYKTEWRLYWRNLGLDGPPHNWSADKF
jgi:hypothetical protein